MTELGDYLRAEEAMYKTRNTRAPTPREQELEAQNKALWELVGETIGYADAMYDGTGPWPHDKKQLENKLAAIQKAREAK
jgi:hypothetical protein